MSAADAKAAPAATSAPTNGDASKLNPFAALQPKVGGDAKAAAGAGSEVKSNDMSKYGFYHVYSQRLNVYDIYELIKKYSSAKEGERFMGVTGVAKNMYSALMERGVYQKLVEAGYDKDLTGEVGEKPMAIKALVYSGMNKYTNKLHPSSDKIYVQYRFSGADTGANERKTIFGDKIQTLMDDFTAINPGIKWEKFVPPHRTDKKDSYKFHWQINFQRSTPTELINTLRVYMNETAWTPDEEAKLKTIGGMYSFRTLHEPSEVAHRRRMGKNRNARPHHYKHRHHEEHDDDDDDDDSGNAPVSPKPRVADPKAIKRK